MRKFLKFLGVLILLFALFVGVSYYYLGSQVWGQFYDSITGHDDDRVISQEEQDALNRAIEEQNGYGDNRPLVYLIAGIDTDDISEGRSDALIVLIVDKKNKSMNMLSLPRDLRIEIPQHGTNKINAAYALGGINLTKHTVSNYLNIPIDQFVVVNFEGFQQLIDTIGGLEVNVEKNMTFDDRITKQVFHLDAGPQYLSGIEALNYSRFRSDAEGDFGRMRRQQQIISEIVTQTATLSNVTKIGDIISVLDDNVRTDVQFNDATKMMISLSGIKASSIESIAAHSYASTIGGASYVIIDESERLRIQETIQQILKSE